jgi:acyl-coenzyme A synthetase/AMP-(fatty) acid ligase/acyl carrier protein
MIPHRAICNHMFWMQTEFPLTGIDRVAQKTSFTFDASVWEFFAPLLAGARLIVAHDRGRQDSEYLTTLITDQEVTVVQVVPSLLQMFLEGNLERCRSLRRVFCGGEALPVELCLRFRERTTASLCNLYGPTEACIDTSFWRFPPDSVPRKAVAPIGRPIANTRMYILDSRLQPVPAGATGELCIGGVGLARGYLNRPELTAEKFIPNPFNGGPGERLYRTGDLARYLPDGNVEFLGRMDHQVKVRGHRVELGEIEAVLRGHPQVSEALVLPREDGPAGKRLVAYVVSIQDRVEVGELRTFLKARLPEYMIPLTFAFLDSLPLTPSGKIDRRALPKPDQSRPELESAFVAPRTRTEELLAGIWAEVLKLEGVGIHDNFFELGGHSLLATQVISRVRKAFQVELPLRSLFETPTVAGLAARVAQKEAPPQDTASVLAQLESLSDEEAQLLLAQESTKAV